PDVLYYGDFHDPDVQRWNNVGFLDNYYQTVADPNSHFTFTPNGRAIAGADINRPLDGRSGFTADDRIAGTHGRPISWDRGTVEMSADASYDSKAVRDLPHDAKDKDDLIYRALYNRDYTNDMPAILPDLKYNDTPWYLADERNSQPQAAQFNAAAAVWEGIQEGYYFSVDGGGFAPTGGGVDPQTDNTEDDHPGHPHPRPAGPGR